MPKIIKTDSETVIKCKKYECRYPSIDKDYFEILTGKHSQQFFIPASCDSIWEYDVTLEQLDFTVSSTSNMVKFEFLYQSNLWRKTYHLELYDEEIVFFYEVEGVHRIDALRFFEGIIERDFVEHFHLTKHFNDKKTTAYQEYRTGSPSNFGVLFNPEANSYNKQYFEYFDYSQVSANSDLEFCGGNFVFNPGIFCFAFAKEQKSTVWFSLGLMVKPGQYLFSEFEYHGGREFGLNLNYWGGLETEKVFQTPKVVICFGNSEFDVLQKYTDLITHSDCIPTIIRDKPPWWRGPIICGWGHQSYQGDIFRVRSPKERGKDSAAYLMSNQTNYESIVNQIDSHQLEWKILIIDAKWTINAGLKIIDEGRWPDMRAFVEKLHRRGKKVLIWWGPWDVEGWTESECITYSELECGVRKNRPGRFEKFGIIHDGMKIAPDTTLKSVRYKIAKQIEYLLSPNGINLDGFKIDHVAATPGIYGMVFPSGSRQLFGVELLHDYHKFIYETAKNIKPDALIIGQSPNPYFRDCIDMIRLGDIYSHNRMTVVKEMEFRVQMTRIANSDWLIDMDGWPMPSLEAFREYLEFQIIHGVPSLYYATHLDTTSEKIPEDIFIRAKDLWHEYVQIAEE